MKKNTVLLIAAILLLIVGAALILNYMAKTRYQSADLSNNLPINTNEAPATINNIQQNDPLVETEAMGVNIYLNNTQNDKICENVEPAYRVLEGMETVIQPTLESLLEGPTAEELEQGYLSNIPEGTRLLSLKFENGIAKANFSSELNQVSGSCTVLGIRAQIEETLKQFQTVNAVEIAIEGQTEGVLQP